MEFTKQDLLQCDNLIKALKKGSFTLGGDEVLAMAQAMSWLGKLNGVIAAQLEPKPPMEMKPAPSPVTPPPKPVKVSGKKA